MKCLLFSDIHLGLKKDSILYHIISKNFILEIIDYAIKHDIKKIFCLGDFFDNRQYINIKTLETAIAIAEIMSDLEFYILLGNHDVHFKNVNYPHSLLIFSKYKNITIIDKEPLIIDKCAFVPWEFTNFKEIEAEYLFGHFDIKNFKMNDTSISYNGIDEKSFHQFKHVYSGHFHFPSSNSNITYLGSPFQMTFADVNSPRGFYEFDDEKLTFIEFTKYPHFHIFNFKNIDNTKINNNYIKIVFDEILSSKETNDIIENVLLQNPLELSTEFIGVEVDNTDISNDIKESLNLSTYDIFKTYYSKISKPEFINDKYLDRILSSLLKKDI